MNIQIFNQEKLDGLEQAIANNTFSIASVIKKNNNPTPEIESKAQAALSGFGTGKNFDLYYIQSILASVGPNKNDDWFFPEEIWAARLTPVHKQLNYMHNEKDIIGTITDSIVLDANGAVVTDEQNISNIKHIATEAVIWTHWDDKKLKDKVISIIASIEKNELFVSMEALFRQFDYILTKGSEVKLVKRDENTAFLSKYLRFYGGSGVYDGYRIYRALRNFTFSGKGIVVDPANPESIIDENLFANAQCSCETECECGEDEDENEDDSYEEVDASLFNFIDSDDDLSIFSIDAAKDNRCWEGYEPVPGKPAGSEDSCRPVKSKAKEKDKAKVKLNKPFRTPGGPKKFSVYVKNEKGNVVKVNFGDPKMEIKRDDPNRRKNFRARHNCSNPGPKWKARYWSCKFWSSQDVSKLTSTKAENNIMDEELKKQIAELKVELSKANDTINSMKGAEAQKTAAQVAELQNQVEALTKVAAETKAAMDKMEKDYAAKMEDMEKDKKEKMKEAEAKLQEAEAKLLQVESEKITAQRISKLVSLKVSEDNASEIVKTFASLNNEMFDKIALLYENKESSASNTSVSDAIDIAKASKKPAEKLTQTQIEGNDRIANLSKSIAQKLTFVKTK
jgi:hypothetical protein